MNAKVNKKGTSAGFSTKKESKVRHSNMYQSIASSTLCQSICCYWLTPFYLQSPSSTPLWLTPVNPYFAQENDLTVNLQEKI